MAKRLKYYILSFVVIIIICGGILHISNSMPQFIKDRSAVRVTYSEKPLSFRMETKNYILTLSYDEISGYAGKAKNEVTYFNGMLKGFCNDIKSNIISAYNKLIDII